MESKLGVVELSLTMWCSLGCWYCPQKTLLNEYYKDNPKRARFMTIDVFKKVLENTEKGSVVSFSGMSEPFSNKKCAEMICYANENGYKVSINTTLMGMTEKDYERIKDVNFERVIIHIPDKEENSHFNITPEYLNLLERVDKSWNIDRYSCHGELHSSIEGIINKEKLGAKIFNDRAGNLKKDDVPKVQRVCGEIYCANSPGRLWHNWCHVVLPDGTLILCCNDYGMKHVIGNFQNETWEQIKNKKSYKKMISGLKDEAIDILCRECSNAINVNRLPAMRLKKMLATSEGGPGGEDENRLRIVKKIKDADMVIGFGLGKLFRDHYLQDKWQELFACELFSDSDKTFWGKTVLGKKVIPPSELLGKKNSLIVMFVRDPALTQISIKLHELGCHNIMAVDDIYDIEFNE